MLSLCFQTEAKLAEQVELNHKQSKQLTIVERRAADVSKQVWYRAAPFPISVPFEKDLGKVFHKGSMIFKIVMDFEGLFWHNYLLHTFI